MEILAPNCFITLMHIFENVHFGEFSLRWISPKNVTLLVFFWGGDTDLVHQALKSISNCFKDINLNNIVFSILIKV